MTMRRLSLLTVFAFAAWIQTGWISVAPDEVALEFRMGRYTGTPLEPGLHLGWPTGLSRTLRVRPGEARTVATGRAEEARRGTGRAGRSARTQFLTADNNIVVVEATAQFFVTRPERYLLGCPDPDALVAQVVQAALAQEIARATIDDVLVQRQAEVARQVAVQAAATLREGQPLDVGVRITAVHLTLVEAPLEVRDAFTLANQALNNRERIKEEANAYRARKIPAARAKAQELKDQAQAARAQRVATARADALRFAGLLTVYRKAPASTRARLYHEAMQEIMPRLQTKVMVDGDQLDLNLMPSRRPRE